MVDDHPFLPRKCKQRYPQSGRNGSLPLFAHLATEHTLPHQRKSQTPPDIPSEPVGELKTQASYIEHFPHVLQMRYGLQMCSPVHGEDDVIPHIMAPLRLNQRLHVSHALGGLHYKPSWQPLTRDTNQGVIYTPWGEVDAIDYEKHEIEFLPSDKRDHLKYLMRCSLEDCVLSLLNVQDCGWLGDISLDDDQIDELHLLPDSMTVLLHRRLKDVQSFRYHPDHRRQRSASRFGKNTTRSTYSRQTFHGHHNNTTQCSHPFLPYWKQLMYKLN